MRRRTFLKNTSVEDDDPLSGMANLFDLAMVFALALMVALVSRFHMLEMFSEDNFTIVKNPGQTNMEIIKKEGKKIEKYKGTKGSAEGKGKKIGAAYQLESGEVIYIPED